MHVTYKQNACDLTVQICTIMFLQNTKIDFLLAVNVDTWSTSRIAWRQATVQKRTWEGLVFCSDSRATKGRKEWRNRGREIGLGALHVYAVSLALLVN